MLPGPPVGTKKNNYFNACSRDVALISDARRCATALPRSLADYDRAAPDNQKINTSLYI
jgi:hypothetical protein